MEVDDDVEDDDMDFNPFLREGSPSETSSSLTSEAECEKTSFDNQPDSEVHPHCSPGDENMGSCALAQNRLSSEGACKGNVPENTSTQVYCENREHLNALGKEFLLNQAACSPVVQNYHHLSLDGSEEDAICRRTRARYSLENHSLEELETFLQESDDEGDLHNVDEEEEYRKFLAAVLSGVGNDTQACQGDENQDEDDNDADFELEIEEALESDGDEIAENYEDANGRDEKNAHRPQTRQKKQFNKLSRAGNYHHELTKSTLRPILPYISHAPLAPGHAYGCQYPSQNALAPSSAAFMNEFTNQQLGQLYVLIYEHVQLLIQTFSLCVLDPCKQNVAIDVKKMIVELVGCRDQALARTMRNTLHQPFCFESQNLCSSVSFISSESLECQWVPLIKGPVMSILDVSPLPLALSYLSDAATAVMKYRRSHLDGTTDKNVSGKEPLFPSLVVSPFKDANNVSQGRSKNVSTASPILSRQLQQRKSLAATLFDSSKKGSVALVPFEIARLAQRFFPLFNSSLFPHKPPSAAMANRVLFTDAEDGLLALGLLEYNNDWGAIQKRFLPCKSKHQIFVRQKNRSSSKAFDNPIKDVRRMKTSPLKIEEIQRIQEGLRIFKNDWASVWRFVVPYRDPSLLQRQWRVATGIQRSYSKSEASKEKRRSYEANRRKLRASMPGSQVVHRQEVDDNASEGVENDDDSYVNEAFLEDSENRSVNSMPCQLPLSSNAGKSVMMQSGTTLNDRCGVVGDGIEQKNDQLQASQLCKEKGSHVVKLAPDLPPVNLPPSVRVISQVAFQQNATHFNGNSDDATKDMPRVPTPTFTESVYRQLNLFPDLSTSARLQQNGMSDRNTTEDGSEQDFQMHPLLFQSPREVPFSHPVKNLGNHTRNYDLFPFERAHVEKRGKQSTYSNENGTHANADTIDFHPLLQRTGVDMYDEVPETDCHQSVSRSERNMNEPPIDVQPTARQASNSLCERENNIDLDIHLCSSMDFRNAKDFRGTFSNSVIRPEGSVKDRPSISGLEVGNSSSRHCLEEHNEELMQGIVMEQEELSDSEDDTQHVEFECEEMDDSEEEQVQSVGPSLTQNQSTATSVDSGELHDQRQIQQGLVQSGKQGASSTQRLQGSSNAKSERAKLKSEHAKWMESRTNQQLSSSCTMKPNRFKTRKSKTQQGQAGAECTSNYTRRTRKNPAPSQRLF